MKNNDVVYALEVSDIQTVAQDSLERELSEAELKQVISEVEKYIPWHDIVDDVIRRTVSL